MDLFPSKVRFTDMFSQPDDSDLLNRTNRNIFPTKLQTTGVNQDTDSEIGRATRALMDTYNEDSPSVNRLNSYVNEQPDPNDYRPSKKRKLGAVLAGFAAGLSNPNAGAAVTRGVLDGPFDEATQQWEAKGGPIKAAANAETQARTQKINSLKDYITATHAQDMERMNQHNIDVDNQREADTLAETKRNHSQTNSEQVLRDANEENDREARRKREADAATETHRHNLATEGINQQRANVYQNTNDNLISYRDHLASQLKGSSKSAYAQKTAQELGTINTVLKPGNSMKYADFYDRDSKGKIVIQPPNKGMFTDDESFNQTMLNYNSFLKEIEAEKNKVLSNSEPVKPDPKSDIPKKPKATVVGRTRDQ